MSRMSLSIFSAPIATRNEALRRLLGRRECRRRYASREGESLCQPAGARGAARPRLGRRACRSMTATIRPVRSSDRADWLQLRRALWPDATADEHARDVDGFFAGDRREPAEVLL